MKFITEKLDKIATTLEEKGYLKEATEIDLISNTIEKIAYRAATDPMNKIINLAIMSLARGEDKKALGHLQGFMSGVDTRASGPMINIPGVRAAIAIYKAATEALSKGQYDPKEITEKLRDAQEFLEKAEPEINKGQGMVQDQKIQPTPITKPMDLSFPARR